MSEILVEPSSQRVDNKVWVWTYGDPVNTSVKVSFINKTTSEEYLEIPENGYFVRFLIKTDLREDRAVLDKNFSFVSRGIFVINLSSDEVAQLIPEANYNVGMALYDEVGNYIRTLVQNLPLRIERSVFKNQLF